VRRLKPPFTQFGGNPEIRTRKEAIRFARVTADELSGIGINMNFAPVLDVAPEGIGSVMAERSFGPDPDRAARLGAAVIRHLQRNGIMAVGKHFPGIGRTTLDSHLDRPVLDVSWRTLKRRDLPPFEAAIAAGVAGLMVSHIVYPRLDPLWPASLSPRIVRQRLRSRMGYEGLVLTDDLDMGAIRKHHDLPAAIRQILAAEVDLVLICHRSPDMEAAAAGILSGLEASKALRESALRSAERILRLKGRYLPLSP